VDSLVHEVQPTIHSILRYPSKTAMSRRYYLVLPLALFCAVSAWAVDPDRRISQYAHAAWRTREAFSDDVDSIAQTADGYVWIGTGDGLLRFDGVRFVPYLQHGALLPSAYIHHLLASTDGCLWIATRGGLSRWKNHTLTNYPGRTSYGAVFEDSKGKIWFHKGLASEKTELCEVVGAKTRCYGTADGVPSANIESMVEDREGNLWLGGDTTLLRWTTRAPHCLPTSQTDNKIERHPCACVDVGWDPLGWNRNCWSGVAAIR